MKEREFYVPEEKRKAVFDELTLGFTMQQCIKCGYMWLAREDMPCPECNAEEVVSVPGWELYE